MLVFVVFGHNGSGDICVQAFLYDDWFEGVGSSSFHNTSRSLPEDPRLLCSLT